jgi:hypothetical protein
MSIDNKLFIEVGLDACYAHDHQRPRFLSWVIMQPACLEVPYSRQNLLPTGTNTKQYLHNVVASRCRRRSYNSIYTYLTTTNLLSWRSWRQVSQFTGKLKIQQFTYIGQETRHGGEVVVVVRPFAPASLGRYRLQKVTGLTTPRTTEYSRTLRLRSLSAVTT